VIGSFDRLGFERHRRRFRAADLDVDLGGVHAIVTGANSGIGYATASALAVRGARVLLACRDGGRGEAARDAIRSQTGSSLVDLAVVDVSDLEAVRAFAEALGWSRVDRLIHNAGLLPRERMLTPVGHELTFATHVLGPHLLTRLLRSRLEASADVRVVWVSSGGMYTVALSLDDLAWERRTYDGVRAYAQTKRMQVALAERWAREFVGTRVSVYAMHPGWAETPGVIRSLPRFHRLTARLLRTAEQGADTVLWLALVREAPSPSGGFFFDREERTRYLLPWTVETPAAREELWQRCEALTTR
jgi:NAD(P)-dependent dehydrogenase (short-subunit alcohol dehydrogenase family)